MHRFIQPRGNVNTLLARQRFYQVAHLYLAQLLSEIRQRLLPGAKSVDHGQGIHTPLALRLQALKNVPYDQSPHDITAAIQYEYGEISWCARIAFPFARKRAGHCLKGLRQARIKQDCRVARKRHHDIRDRQVAYLRIRVHSLTSSDPTMPAMIPYSNIGPTVRFRIAPSLLATPRIEQTATILLMHTMLPIAAPTDCNERIRV